MRYICDFFAIILYNLRKFSDICKKHYDGV